MDPEERSQVISSCLKAMEMLRGSKKEHKKGVSALIKLTGRKEYAELAGSTWMGENGAENGAAMTVDFLQNCNLEDENLQELIGEHLRLVTNALKVERLVRRLADEGLAEALMRVMALCPVSELVRRALRAVGLVSADPSAMKQLVELNAMAEIMNHVSIKVGRVFVGRVELTCLQRTTRFW
jgi:hypothetical protein